MANDTTTGSGVVDILLRRGAVTREALAMLPGSEAVPIERRLMQSQTVSADDLTLAIAEFVGLPPIKLTHFAHDAALLDLQPKEQWERTRTFPLAKSGRVLTVALADPFDVHVVENLGVATGLQVVAFVAPEKEIAEMLGRATTGAAMAAAGSGDLDLEDVMRAGDGDIQVDHDSEKRKDEESLEKTLETAEGAPVIRMVNMILIEAMRTKASDIHIEALEKSTRLRYRLDGVLVERPSPPRAFHNAIVSRIKIMSDLDIAERRQPQDGRFKVKAFNREVDVRVSILPTVFGEKVVMRTLDKSNLAPGLSHLGLDEFAYKAMRYAIDQPHGILLVTGPTGSGKTTTLYSCLQDLNTVDVNIVTAEDPVEYQIAGINQVHVNTQVGLSFASVLRSVLRQDPDIILVGEIRDGETADIAVKAALTGHLVLSTLHTNDAAGVIARLVDMGVPPFLIASSLILAQAQRLYRRLCTACRRAAPLSDEVLAANHIDPAFFVGAQTYVAAGCPRCNGTGYKGRAALMEVLPVDDAIREAIVRGRTTPEIRALAVKSGMLSLKEVGLAKVRDGITSLAAALEVTGGD
jgi:type IV pilus assembly protein PilB